MSSSAGSSESQTSSGGGGGGGGSVGSSSAPPTVTLLAVTFGSGWDVYADDGSGKYKAPHWDSNQFNQKPYMYQVFPNPSTLAVTADFSYQGDSASLPLVKGTGPKICKDETSLIIPAVQTVLKEDGVTLEIPFTYATSELMQKTAHYSSMEISWEYSLDKGKTWQSAGKSENEIFIVIGPTSSGYIPYRTVAYLACCNPGATTIDQAVVNTFNKFKERNVCKWNDVSQKYDLPLYYYRPGYDFSQNPGIGLSIDPVESTRVILNTLKENPYSTARCGIWQGFFIYVIQLDGAMVPDAVNNGKSTYQAKGVYVVSGVDLLFVKSWLLTDPNKQPPYTFMAANPIIDPTHIRINEMVLEPNDHPPGSQPPNYGDITAAQGVPGQNSDTPSEKIWADHAIVMYTDSSGAVIYYDPSYGLTYTSEQDFQNQAIYGYGSNSAVDPNTQHAICTFTQVSQANLQIYFANPS